MQENRGILTLILFIFLISCTAKFATIYHDPFDNYTKTTMCHNKIGDDYLLSFSPTISIIPQIFQKDGQISYSLIISYISKDWIFIEPGESLVFLIDGKRFGFFSQNGSQNNRDVFFGNVSVRFITKTGLLGRWQILQQEPLVIADTGHNEAGIKEVLNQIRLTPHCQLHFI